MVKPAIDYDVKDLSLAPEGVRRIEWAAREMPVIGLIRERVRQGEAAGKACASPPACTSPPRRPTWRSPCPTAAPRSPSAPATRSAPRTTSPPRWSASTASPTFAIKGEDDETYYRHIHQRAGAASPRSRMDDGADLVATLHKERRDLLPDDHRRHRGDDHRRHPPAQHGPRRRPRLPHHRRQRRRHQAPLRQPLRHRPEHASTASPAPPTSSGRARTWSSAATAGAAAASPCGPAAWARRSSSPR